MATAEEILNKQFIDAICVIDPFSRTITVPEELAIFGVESDEKSQTIPFRMANIFGDISNLKFYVNYQNSKGYKGSYSITDVTVTDDTINFTWTLDRVVTISSGSVSFIICVQGDEYEWNTTLASAKVLPGLEVTETTNNAN